MNVFIKENPDQGLLVTLRNINHYFKILASVGNVSIDFKVFRLKITNYEDGDYQAIMTFGKVVITAVPNELTLDIGNAVSIVCDDKVIKAFINKGYTFDSSIDNAVMNMNTLNLSVADTRAVFTRNLEVEAGKAIISASEMIIRGGGSLLIKAADMTIQAGNLVNNVTTFAVKSRDAVSIASVMGGTSIYGGTGVVVSTSSKDVKPVAATVHIESDRIIGRGMVDLGKQPLSVAAKGDMTAKSINQLISALSTFAAAVSPVTAFAPGPCPIGGAGVALQSQVQAIKAVVKQIECKDVKVS